MVGYVTARESWLGDEVGQGVVSAVAVAVVEESSRLGWGGCPSGE